MSRLYPDNLKNTHCVAIVGDGQVATISTWDRDNPAVIAYYEVENVERLRACCERRSIYFVDAPSEPICEFDDGGEDFNRAADSRFFATLLVFATTKEGAKITANQIADTYGAVDIKAGGAIDVDWPKYPDLIYKFRFTLYFGQEPDWDAMPFDRFRLN